MFGLGTTELIVILVIVLIVFGVGKLPDIGSGMGKAIKNFKKASSDAEIDVTPEKERLDSKRNEKTKNA
ncbi:MAG: twin-arginine translocase TatA/TatE family subunit [Deltaproteobacteria bacterium]|nr:twin-arginine translocase TatA/TatE family subunit [Deltaproteobacteria bacterium]